MGLFDWVTICVPPPGMPREGWQTKDLDCWMGFYEIAADGAATYHQRLNDIPQPVALPGSFALINEVAGEFVELQCDVDGGRVTKIRTIRAAVTV